MAHEIDMSNGRANIVYAGQVPWHGLGQAITPDAPLDVWCKEAGMDWNIEEAPVLYLNSASQVEAFPERKILYRSDTKAPLADVSDKFITVQPREIIEFYRDLLDAGGFQMETAGVLFGGKRYWALAKIGEQSNILTVADPITGYLLLATACDGSFATTCMTTSVRTVCNNTLSIALRRGDNGVEKRCVKVPHSTTFNPDVVKAEMGLVAGAWTQFIEESTVMAKRQVTDVEALQFIINIMGDPTKGVDVQPNPKAIAKVLQLFKGQGKGSDLVSAKDTAWGLVNAVTEYVDHHRLVKTADARFEGSFNGEWANIKNDAYEEALKLAA